MGLKRRHFKTPEKGRLTFFFNASIAASALTVGRPKQFTIAFVTLFVETFRLIVAPNGAKAEPVEERMSLR